MTNYERIKNMSVEELAIFINDIAVCCFKDAECEIVRLTAEERRFIAAVQL